MREIAIVGAGQAGLCLALGLLDQGYHVTLVTDRTASDIRHGSVMSAQCLFEPALAHERTLGLDHWADTAPRITRFQMHLVDETDASPVHWEAQLDHPAQAIDQRIKFPTWLGLVEARGGRIRFARVDIPELEALAHAYDLVVVAAGRNSLGRLFERDANHSPFAQPQRTTVLLSVRGAESYPTSAALSVNLIPGVGEYIALPGQSMHGACLYGLFACVPGGPLDAWDEATTPVAHLNQAHALLDTWLPWEAQRLADAVLTDPRSTVRLRMTPIVRQPVGRLPLGKRVLGLGDTVILNDPLTLQGANLATQGAAIYLDAIVQHGHRPFDEDWMRATFERVWDAGQSATQWTNTMLTPMLVHHRDLLRAAVQAPDLAHRLAHAFTAPDATSPWLLDTHQVDMGTIYSP